MQLRHDESSSNLGGKERGLRSRIRSAVTAVIAVRLTMSDRCRSPLSAPPTRGGWRAPLAECEVGLPGGTTHSRYVTACRSEDCRENPRTPAHLSAPLLRLRAAAARRRLPLSDYRRSEHNKGTDANDRPSPGRRGATVILRVSRPKTAGWPRGPLSSRFDRTLPLPGSRKNDGRRRVASTQPGQPHERMPALFVEPAGERIQRLRC